MGSLILAMEKEIVCLVMFFLFISASPYAPVIIRNERSARVLFCFLKPIIATGMDMRTRIILIRRILVNSVCANK